VLRQRLEQRGRENAEQIEQRLQRAALYSPEGGDCLILNNDGSLLQSAALFMRLLAQHRSNVIPLHRKEPRHV
jgi:ribose 1,5-bisphosphokinase